MTERSTDATEQFLGVFDCPRCSTTIIGRYSDLLAHVRDEHPLAAKLLVNEDGETLEDEIKSAQKAHLKARIEDEMVVNGEQSSTATEYDGGESP